jgi:hypothetical protein
MRRTAATLAILGFLLLASAAQAARITFDDPGLGHLSEVTSYYAGVQLHGIPNIYPLTGGPYPYATQALPGVLGGAAAWNPYGLTAPGESAPNFAVGLGQGSQPGDAGILIHFETPISSLTLTGLDFGDYPPDAEFPLGDIEQMTLSAWDAQGRWLGQQNFSQRFATGAIRGTLSLPGMSYVAFNYTDTDFGFYGIDDLEYSAAAPVPLPATALLLGSGLVGLGWRRLTNRRAS